MQKILAVLALTVAALAAPQARAIDVVIPIGPHVSPIIRPACLVGGALCGTDDSACCSNRCVRVPGDNNNYCANTREECRYDNDCRRGEECFRGRCEGRREDCRYDNDCRAGDFCNREGRCEPRGDECRYDSDCRYGQFCNNWGRCEYRRDRDECRYDNDCQRDQYCDGGRCRWRPSCLPSGARCGHNGNNLCCSHVCVGVPGNNNNYCR